MKNYAIILASGKGERFGSDLPKQFALLNGKTLLENSVEIFEQNENVDEIIVVITPEYKKKSQEILKKYKKVNKIIEGGLTRKESSAIGISSIEENEANVLIHDCARPLLSQNVLNECIYSLNKYDAVAVACESTDTIIETEGDFIKSIPQRSSVMNIQTPQCFKLSLINKAHQLSKNDSNFTDDCGLVVRHALSKVYIVKGESDNIKITYPKDLFIAEKIIQNKK